MASVGPLTIGFDEPSLAALARLEASPTDTAVADLRNGQDCARRLEQLLQDRGTVSLPPGQYVLDASTLRLPAGSRLLSGPKAMFQLKNSPPSHNFFRLSPGVQIHGLRATCDEGPAVGTGAIILGVDCDSVVITDTHIYGPGQRGTLVGSQTGISLWRCSSCLLQRVSIHEAGGGAYGLEVIGGADNLFHDLGAQRCGADGIKVMGSAAYGVPYRMRFTACGSHRNGQAVMCRDYPRVPVTSTTGATIEGPGGWVIAPTAAGYSVALPERDGVYVLYLADECPSVRATFGPGLSQFLFLANPKLATRFVCAGGVWTVDNWTNGEGWDLSGVGHRLTDCAAQGNSGGGFQVKPGSVAGSDTADITFTTCRAWETWDGNGFAVVNNTNGQGCPTGITFTACGSHRNSQAGFAFTTGLMRGMSLAQCQGHGNGGPGLNLQEWCRDVNISGLWLAGNGRGRPAGNPGYNWQQRGGKRIFARGVTLAGTEPSPWGQADADYEAPGGVQGFYLLRDCGNGQVADRVAIEAQCHGHYLGTDADIYATPTRKGTRADFPGLVIR